LNIDFDINKERQHCKIGTVCRVTCGMGRVNERDESEGIWWMDFIYLNEIKQRNLLH
jgi:hypothetical protein